MHVRVYHPETCEPFDVTPSKASELVLEKGWSQTPWQQAEPAPEPVIEEPVRGRGRRRRVEEEAAPVQDEIEAEATDADEADVADEEVAERDDDLAENWRS